MSSSAIDWPISSSVAIAELPRGGGIGELDHAVGVERQDRVGRAADHGVVTGVLALAQDALAARHDGDVDDLQQALQRSAGSPIGADGDVVDQRAGRRASAAETPTDAANG